MMLVIYKISYLYREYDFYLKKMIESMWEIVRSSILVANEYYSGLMKIAGHLLFTDHGKA